MTGADGARPALVATDLDGTMLRSDRTVSPRTREQLDRARDRGVLVVPATARQLQLERHPRPGKLQSGPGIAAMAGFTDWAVCSNGALVVHLGTGEVVHEACLSPRQQHAVVSTLLDVAPGTEFVTVAEAAHLFRTSPGYPALASPTDHMMEPDRMCRVGLDELVDRPALKMVVRHPEIPPDDLAARLAGLTEIEVTSSGIPVLEISAAGVTKASGVAVLAEHLGVSMAQVVAYGDAPNDIAMLRAAGLGVAMPHAAPEVIAAADTVAEHDNDNDGMVRHLAALLRPDGVGEVSVVGS